MKLALKDKFYLLRTYALGKLNLKDPDVAQAMEPIIMELAKTDERSIVRGNATGILAMFADNKYKDIFTKGVNDSSYTVAGAALEGLYAIDSSAALQAAKKMSAGKIKGRLTEAITKVLVSAGDESGFDLIAKSFDEMPAGQAKFNLIVPFSQLLAKTNDTQKLKKGIDLITEFRDSIPAEYGIAPYINDILNKVAAQKTNQEQADYIKSKTN